MWKTLTTTCLLTTLLTTLLTSLSADSLADGRDDRRRHWDDRRDHWQGGHERYRGYHKRRHGRFRGPPGHRRWAYGPYSPYHRFYGDRWGPYWSGALLGTALTYSIVQGHDHHRSCDHRRQATRLEVAGCYRIERLPDGRERRVELPPGACR